MNILLVNTLYQPYIIGGAERVVSDLAQWLWNIGHKVSIACTSPTEGIQIKTQNNIKTYYVGLRNLYWPYDKKKHTELAKALWHGFDTLNLAMANQIQIIIEQVQPDVIHTHTLSGWSVGIWQKAKQKNVPVVHTLHDYYLLCPRTTMYDRGRNCDKTHLPCNIYSTPKKFATRWVQAVTGVSNWILNKHVEMGYFKDTRIKQVITNPTPEPSLSILSQADGQISKKITLGYLGRLHPTKGVDTWLQNIFLLMKYFPLEIYLAGKGDEAYEKILWKKYSHPNIHFLGFVKPETLFSKIDLLVLPSLWYDPQPKVITEAFLYGIPVIATNRGGAKEIVEDGETGFVFDPENYEQLRQIISLISDNKPLLNQLRININRKMAAISPDIVFQRYSSIYSYLIGNK